MDRSSLDDPRWVPREPEPSAAEGGAEPGYSSHIEVYKGIMSGALTVSEARRLVRELEGPGPFEPEQREPTTELVREEDGLDFQLGEPTELPDDTELEDDGRSGFDFVVGRISKSQTIADIEDAGNAVAQGLDRALTRPQPTGAYIGTDKYPVVHQAPREAFHGGEIAILPVLLALGADRVIRWARRDRSPSRGDRDDAGH